MTSLSSNQAGAAAGAPRPALSVFDAVMIITGIVIGGGIFSMPPLVAGVTGSVQWMLVAWLAGGALSLIGALVYAELATTYPSAGGDYHFLTRAYGRDLSFFFAWARVTVITTGSIAMLAFIFGDYMSRVWSLGAHSSTLYAVLTVAALTAVNVVGLRESSRAQNVLTLLLIAGLALVAVAGIAAFAGGRAPTPVPGPAAGGLPPAFGLAMVFVLLTFGGWNEAAYISAEVKGGNRAIMKALVGALLLITAIYLLVVLAMLYGLGFDALAGSQAVGAASGQLILWFPDPVDGFKVWPGNVPASGYPNSNFSDNYCKIANDLSTASSIAVDDDGNVYVANAGKSESRGVEVEVTARPLDAVELFGAVGFLDTEFDSYVDQFGQDVRGRSLPFAPDNTVSAGAQYNLALGETGTGYARAEYFRVGDFYYDAGNREKESYELVNLRVLVKRQPAYPRRELARGIDV